MLAGIWDDNHDASWSCSSLVMGMHGTQEAACLPTCGCVGCEGSPAARGGGRGRSSPAGFAPALPAAALQLPAIPHAALHAPACQQSALQWGRRLEMATLMQSHRGQAVGQIAMRTSQRGGPSIDDAPSGRQDEAPSRLAEQGAQACQLLAMYAHVIISPIAAPYHGRTAAHMRYSAFIKTSCDQSNAPGAELTRERGDLSNAAGCMLQVRVCQVQLQQQQTPGHAGTASDDSQGLSQRHVQPPTAHPFHLPLACMAAQCLHQHRQCSKPGLDDSNDLMMCIINGHLDDPTSADVIGQLYSLCRAGPANEQW